MTPFLTPEADRIRNLNDRLRTHFIGGHVVITSGTQQLGQRFRIEAVLAVRRFATFDADTDPYGEHDFGEVTILGELVFWKIDYYDRTLEAGSPDPSDPSVTTRVLTIMLAAEY